MRSFTVAILYLLTSEFFHQFTYASPVRKSLNLLQARDKPSATAHTCLKNQGSGNVCDSETSISACNGAVDTVCWQANNNGTNSKTTCVNNSNADCFAAMCIPANQNTSYAACVAGFQDIMSDCIDPSGAGYKKTQQGGSRNIHFNDHETGTYVDNNQPTWAIGAKKCYQGGNVAVVNVPTPGGAVLAPRTEGEQEDEGEAEEQKKERVEIIM